VCVCKQCSSAWNRTIFLCHTAPTPTAQQSGQTEFIDLAQLYSSLPAPLQRVADETIVTRRGKTKDTPGFVTANRAVNRSPLVRVHPSTGRRALWGSPGYFRPGTEYSTTVSDQGLNALLAAVDPVQGAERSTHDRFVLRHGYERGDVVMWDNYSV
jgi:alpha-ketoglutarate-dependent taurine dioxygenase